MIRDIRLIGQLEHANNWRGGSSGSVSDGDDPHIGDVVAYSALGLSLDGKGLGGLAGCGRRCCLVGFGKLGPWAGNG